MNSYKKDSDKEKKKSKKKRNVTYLWLMPKNAIVSTRVSPEILPKEQYGMHKTYALHVLASLESLERRYVSVTPEELLAFIL